MKPLSSVLWEVAGVALYCATQYWLLCSNLVTWHPVITVSNCTISGNSADKWYARAAEQGHLEAQKYLANMYYTGQGVTMDPVEAYAWALRAAMNGDPLMKNALDGVLPHDQIAAGKARAMELAKEMKQ